MNLSVKRRELVKYFEENNFYLVREGANHSIYTNGSRTVPIKRHRTIDRITANEICKQAGLKAKF
jgi:mRNA interferase HicA